MSAIFLNIDRTGRTKGTESNWLYACFTPILPMVDTVVGVVS